jgi:hypothetical protein
MFSTGTSCFFEKDAYNWEHKIMHEFKQASFDLTLIRE